MTEETASDRLEQHRDTDLVCTACRWRAGHSPDCPRKDEPWPTIEARRPSVDEGLQRSATADFGPRKTSREIVDEALERLRADLAEVFTTAAALTRPVGEGEEELIERIAPEVFAAVCPGSKFEGEARAAYEEVVRQTLQRAALRSTPPPPQAEETKPIREALAALEDVTDDFEVRVIHAKAILSQALSTPSSLPIAAEGSALKSLIFACDSALKDYEGQGLSGDWLVAVLKPAIERARKALNTASPIPPDHVLVPFREWLVRLEAAEVADDWRIGVTGFVTMGDLRRLLSAAPQPPSPGQGYRLVATDSGRIIVVEGSGPLAETICDIAPGQTHLMMERGQKIVAALNSAPPSSGEAEAVARNGDD